MLQDMGVVLAGASRMVSGRSVEDFVGGSGAQRSPLY